MVGSVSDWSRLLNLARLLRQMLETVLEGMSDATDSPPGLKGRFATLDRARRRMVRDFSYHLAEDVIINLVATVAGRHVSDPLFKHVSDPLFLLNLNLHFFSL